MKKRLVIALILVLAVIGLAKVSIPKEQANTQPKTHKVKKVSTAEAARPYADPSDLRKEGTWKKKSEAKPYPKINNKKGLVIRVSLKGNRVYVVKNKKVIYTMLSTAGTYVNGKSYTPTGTFWIRSDCGTDFFNPKLNEGAKDWRSWDKKNLYLFHSVPTKKNGKFNIEKAKKLGKTQDSHGCIRLSLPDAKWFMKNIPVGTKVIIKDE